MLTGYNESLEEKLKLAEQAESEVTRLQPLASEAPQLRAEKVKLQKAAKRQRAKATAMDQATQALTAASEKQSRIPELLGTAARAVNDFYSTLRDVEARRQDAMQSLAVVDRIEYDIELEDGEAHEASLDRDPRGVAYALAAHHGDGRVKKLLEELEPGFNLLGGCNMDDPLYRDVANFVMARVTPAAPVSVPKKKKAPDPDPKIEGPVQSS